MEEDSGNDLEGDPTCHLCQHFLQAHDTAGSCRKLVTHAQTPEQRLGIHTKRVQL